MSAFDHGLNRFSDDHIGKTDKAIGAFVNEINDGYYGAYTQAPKNEDSQYDFMPRIGANDFIGRFNGGGAFEPMMGSRSLSSKLSSSDIAAGYSQSVPTQDSFEYARNIYGSMGLKSSENRSYVGDLSSISTPPEIHVTKASASSGRLGGGNAQGMETLKSSFNAMQERLRRAGINSYVQTKFGEGVLAGKAQTIEVAIPRMQIGPGGRVLTAADIKNNTGYGSDFKIFTFTATAMGVIEAPSNLYINGSVYRNKDGSVDNVNAFDTAARFVETYARAQEIAADQGTSLAFRQFMEKQQRLGAKQTYIEVDQFLGKEFGYSTFRQAVRSLSSTTDIHQFQSMQLKLADSLFKLSEQDQRTYSQVSRNELATIRRTTIENILKPLGNMPNREAASAQVIQNFAKVMMQPYFHQLADGTEVRLDPFTALKQNMLIQSPSGLAILTQQIKAAEKNILQKLRMPFLQPHSANFSGGQLGSKRAYYSDEGGPLTRSSLEGAKLLTPGTYTHGSGVLPVGSNYVSISSQSTNTKTTQTKHHDSQLGLNALEVASFYDLKGMFKSSAQLNVTTLAQMRGELHAMGYTGVALDNWIGSLKSKQKLDIEDEENASILMVPYKKPEQIPQRLKNLSGTRSAAQYSSAYYEAILAQEDLGTFKDNNGNISRGKTLSGNVNTVLPQAQYQQLQEFLNQNPGINPATKEGSSKVLNHLREIEANPFSEIRGSAGAEYQKRVLIQTGLNQSSDFMHINAAHKATYGYEQYTKIEPENIVEYSTAGTKIMTTNVALDKQRALMQKAFAPGRTIFYSPIELKNAKAVSALEKSYSDTLKALGITPLDIDGNLVVNKAAMEKLKQDNRFIKKMEFNKGQISFTLKEGLYGNDDSGTLRNYGLFEEGSSRLIIGLGVSTNSNGDIAHTKNLAVKISGTLRKDQKGVAVVNDTIEFNEQGGRLVGHAAYTILFDGSVRPGVENVKGPARIDSSAQFDYHATNLVGHEFYSERTLDQHIYATASAASLKGYNYESGLDVLSTQKSFDTFRNKLTTDSSKSLAIFASYFSGSLESYVGDQTHRDSLKALSGQLQSAIGDILEAGNKSEQQLGAQIRKGRVSKDLIKNTGLFVNNAGMFSLIAGAGESGYNSAHGEPLIQLQQEMLKALQGGKASSDQMMNRILGLIDATQSSSHSTQIDGYRSFRQDSSTNRAASVVTSLLSLTYQSIGYSESQRNNPLGGALLELGLINAETGRINNDVLLGQHHDAAMDLFIRAKASLPGYNEIQRLKSQYAQGKTDFSSDRAYQQLEDIAANIYAASQTAIPLSVSIRILPSKILQAAGSKDIASMEYHYSAVMSKRQMDEAKGYVTDVNEISELTHAHHILTNFTQDKGYKNLKIISAFNSDQGKIYSDVIEFMNKISPLAAELKGYRDSGNAFYKFAMLKSGYHGPDTDAHVNMLLDNLTKIKDVAYNYLGEVDERHLPQRAKALAILSDSRRAGNTHEQGRLSNRQAQASQFDTKGKTLIFFDIETRDLVDTSKAVGDRSRYPKEITELAFIVRKDGKKNREVSGKEIIDSSDPKNTIRLSQAIDKMAKILKSDPNAVLVGHNIRAFDIPTLRGELEARGVDPTRIRSIDTLEDIDKGRASREYGVNKFKLGLVYEHQQIEDIHRQMNAATSLNEKRRLQTMLDTRSYMDFGAHEALNDIRVNIKVFDYLTQKNLFAQKKAQGDSFGQHRLSEYGNIYFYDAAQHATDLRKSDSIYSQVLKLATDVAYSAKNKNALYELHSNLDYYTSKAQGGKYEADLVVEYTRNLLSLASNDVNKLNRDKDSTNLHNYLTGIAIKSDSKLIDLIEKGMNDGENNHVDALGKLAKTFLTVKAELSLDPTKNAEHIKTAENYYRSIYDSKTVALPLMQFEDARNGTFKAKFVSSGEARGHAMFGNSLLLVGLDVLQQLPQKFETFVPEVIRHRKELDSVLPEYFKIMGKVQESIVTSGEAHISKYERSVIDRMESLAYKNRELMSESAGGTFAQRAMGEKNKNMGVSSTAVASYLVGIDEIAVGQRYEETLGKENLQYKKELAKLEPKYDEMMRKFDEAAEKGKNLAPTSADLKLIDRVDQLERAIRRESESGKNNLSLFRAGGPSFASQLSQEHKVISIAEHVSRSNGLNSLVSLDAESNRTTVLTSLHGRFGSQGGDFDGDSYAVMGKFREEALTYEKLRRNIFDLEDQQKRVQHDRKNSYRGNKEYFEVLKDVLSDRDNMNPDPKNYHAEVSQILDRAGLSELKDIHEDRVERIFLKSLERHGTNKAEYSNRLRDTVMNLRGSKLHQMNAYEAGLERTALDPEVVDFVKNRNKKSITELEEFIRVKSDQPPDYFANLQRKAYLHALDSLANKVDRMTVDNTPDYLQYLDAQDESYEAQINTLKIQANRQEKTLDTLYGKTQDIAKQSIAAMRRHVSSYIGLPTALLDSKSGLFHNAEVFNMIEQQRGVLPSIQENDASVVNAGSMRSNIVDILSILHENSRGFNEAGISRALKLTKADSESGSARMEAAQHLEQFLNADNIERMRSMTPTERLNNVIKDLNTSALGDAHGVIAKITANAGGTALSESSFHALQAVIGSSGTSLIGEGYNAITTLVGKTLLARSISESFQQDLTKHTGVDTGIEKGEYDSGKTMYDITRDNFNKLFPAGQNWGSAVDQQTSSNLTEARNILQDILQRPEDMAVYSLNRAQSLTGLLGNVQQTVRDSLKQKVDGGLLGSIKSNALNSNGTTIFDILTSDTSTENERYVAMRMFLAEEAGTSIFSINGEKSHAENQRYKITAFGSLFLLSDFLKKDDISDYDKMVGLDDSADPENTQRYGFLKERYETIQGLVHDNDPNMRPEQRQRYTAMLKDSQTFVAQSVVDLLNISLAQRSVHEAAFAGGTADEQNAQLDQMRRIREGTRVALGGETSIALTDENISHIRQFTFARGSNTSSEQIHDVRTALFIGTGGEDLLSTDDQRLAAARKMGMDSYDGNEFEFYQKITTQSIYSKHKHEGLTVTDLMDMRESAQATKYLRYQTIEGSTTFKNFLERSSAASDALMTQLMRDQISDPKQLAMVSYEAGAQLFSAMGELQEKIRGVYGDVAANSLHSMGTSAGHPDVSMPVETLQAMKNATDIFGVVNQMIETGVSSEVKSHVANMFGISMSAKNEHGESGYTQMANTLAGLAQVNRNQSAMMRAHNEDSSYVDTEGARMQEQYEAAIAKDNSPSKVGQNQLAFLQEQGRRFLQSDDNLHVDLTQQHILETEKGHAQSKRASIASAFAAPAFLTILGSNIESDANLTSKSVDLLMAAAQVQQNHQYERWNAGAYFQVERMTKTIRTDGVIMGGVRAIASELMFESVSRASHQMMGGKRGTTGTIVAEVLSTALGMALQSAITERPQGALSASEDTYQAQALYELPGIGIGIASSAIEEFLNSTSMEAGDDEEINYDVDLSNNSSAMNQDMQTNYSRLDINDEFGENMSTSFSTEEAIK